MPACDTRPDEDIDRSRTVLEQGTRRERPRRWGPLIVEGGGPPVDEEQAAGRAVRPWCPSTAKAARDAGILAAPPG